MWSLTVNYSIEARPVLALTLLLARNGCQPGVSDSWAEWDVGRERRRKGSVTCSNDGVGGASYAVTRSVQLPSMLREPVPFFETRKWYLIRLFLMSLAPGGTPPRVPCGK